MANTSKARKKVAKLMQSGVAFNPSKISRASREEAAEDTKHYATYLPEDYGGDIPTVAQVKNPTPAYVDNSVVTKPFKMKKNGKK